MWLRRWRKRAQDHVDAWRFILAMPRRGKTSGETHAAAAVLRRHDPDHGATRPGQATLEECIRLLQRRRDIGGKNRVICAGGRLAASQPLAMMKGGSSKRASRAAACAPRARSRSSGGSMPQGMSQLPAAGADIEQIAGLPKALTDQRRHARDIVGAVDPRGVELDRIDRRRRRDVLRRAQRNPRPRSICVTTKGNGHDDTRGNNSSPRTAAVGPSPSAVWCNRSGQHQDTPPAAPARDFPVAGLLAHGSSPPTTFPRTHAVLSGSFGRRLAAYSCGAAAALCKCTHRVPF